MAADSPPAAPAAPTLIINAAPPADAASTLLTEAQARSKHFAELTEGTRKRADLTAKALGALGTTAVSAIGIAKFADIFPLPPWRPWVVVACIGLLLGFCALVVVV